MTTNKVAIVTGANKGLGFAIVKLLSEKYTGKVYLTSRDEKRGIEARDELKKLGLNPVYYQLDVTDNESIKRFLNNIQDKNEEVEILINNAGILFLKSSEPKIYQAEQTIFVNFTSLVNFTEAILHFVKKGGKIVNISSSSGHLSRIPSKELQESISSKNLALEELQRLINNYVKDVKAGEEINKGVTVNCVHPGYVMSDMTFGAGSISPADAAILPVSLALESNVGGRYVWNNGQDVPWDGEDPRKYIDGRNV